MLDYTIPFVNFIHITIDINQAFAIVKEVHRNLVIDLGCWR